MAFWNWEYGTLAPCPLPRGLTGPGWKRTGPTSGKHQARRTCQGPGPGLREGEGSQRAPPPHTHISQTVSAGAEEGPGLALSPAPPAAGFHPQIWPRVPQRRKPSLLNAGKTGWGDDPVSRPKARRRRREDRRTRNG